MLQVVRRLLLITTPLAFNYTPATSDVIEACVSSHYVVGFVSFSIGSNIDGKSTPVNVYVNNEPINVNANANVPITKIDSSISSKNENESESESDPTVSTTANRPIQ